jgi:hypothetical protein
MNLETTPAFTAAWDERQHEVAFMSGSAQES